MRAKEFLNNLFERRLDPELQRLYKRAAAHYPMYDEDTAILKFLQRSSKHSEEKDAQLEKEIVKLDKRVTKIEKSGKK